MTRFVTGIIAVAVLAVAGYLMMGPQGGAGNTTANPLIGAANAQDAADIDTSSIVEMAIGSEDAPVTIIEYASFTCPHCANYHAGPFKQLKTDYIDTGKVRFIFREVYFDRFGLWASMIARCSGPEKFFGISDLIFEGQGDWSRAASPGEVVEGLRKIGRLAGSDIDTIEACLQDADKAQTLIAWYQQNAKEHGIKSTPSFVVNGKMVENQAYDSFSAIIDAEVNN